MFFVEICLSKMGELWANVDDAAALYLPPWAPGCCQPGSPSGLQWAWAGRVIVACFFHNTCKLTLWTIWRILFFILSIILDENVKGNSQFDLKYFGSLKEYSQTSSSSTPIGNELGKKTKQNIQVTCFCKPVALQSVIVVLFILLLLTEWQCFYTAVWYTS